MIDISSIAQGITVTVLPYLPALTELGKEVSKEVAKKTVDAGWEKASLIWTKLHPKIEESPAAQLAIRDIISEPQEVAFHTVFTRRIAELLAANPEMRDELAALLLPTTHANSAVASGQGAVAIGGSAANFTIITGSNVKPD